MDVAWTSRRPIVPDQHWSRVVVEAESEVEGELAAIGMVMGRSTCVMPTRSEIVALVL